MDSLHEKALGSAWRKDYMEAMRKKTLYDSVNFYASRGEREDGGQ